MLWKDDTVCGNRYRILASCGGMIEAVGVMQKINWGNQDDVLVSASLPAQLILSKINNTTCIELIYLSQL